MLTIIFCAALVRSTFGFGDALISMPLLAMLIGIRTGTPLVALISITISGTILMSQLRNVHFKSVWLLIVSTLFGIPIGLYLLKGIGENVMKLILSLVLIAFSAYRIFKPRLFALKNDKFACIFGFLGGILGGAYNTNGPAVVVYGTLRKWDPEKFRATLQGYFFPTGVLIALGHGLSGLWTRQVWGNYLISLPVVCAAIFLGGRINRKIPKGKFDNCIYIFLLVVGIVLFIDTARLLAG